MTDRLRLRLVREAIAAEHRNLPDRNLFGLRHPWSDDDGPDGDGPDTDPAAAPIAA